MAREKDQQNNDKEPKGFTPETEGPAAKAASEEGWGLNEEERKKKPPEKRPEYGGTDYDYGARDFGDVPSHAEADAAAEVLDRERKKKAS